MKRLLPFLILLAGCASSRNTAAKHWSLVWGDEFNYTGLPDSTKWRYERGFVRNHEPQYYTVRRPENARVEDGHLVIETRKEPYRQAAYTSASINTRGKFAFGYGRLEVRAKLPEGSGIWPAIWMLGATQPWPAGGEIDIMEYEGSDTATITATVHSPSGWTKGRALEAVRSPSRGYHVYAVERYPDRMDFFFDNHRYFTCRRAFQGTFYLLLNTALKSELNGQPILDDGIFPQSFLVDYVRYYAQIP